MNKLVTKAAALVASAALALVSYPANAAVVDPGAVVILNEDGGTNSSNGLATHVAFGQIQIFLEGDAQLYGTDDLPEVADYGNMSNYPVIAFDDVENFNIGYGLPWESFTSDYTPSDSGRSGVVVNRLTYGAGATEVVVDFTVDYTYPNNYFTVTLELVSAGADYTGLPYRFYWFTDAALGGSDSGFQFGGTTPEGQTVGGVYSQAGDQIEAYREIANNDLDWFSGYYGCPTGLGDKCVTGAAEDGDWVGSFEAFPNASFDNGEETLDNGFGVSGDVNDDQISFDLIFAKCLDGSPALQCADAALSPKLADTGIEANNFGLVAAGLIAAGGIALAVRRRKA